GHYWFNVNGSGLIYYDSLQNRSIYMKHVPGDTTSIATNSVTSLLLHPDGTCWITHSNGILENLQAAGPAFKVTRRYTFIQDAINEKTQSFACNVMSDRDGHLWINSSNYDLGAFYFKPASQSIQHLHTRSKTGRLSSNLVTRIVQDNKGHIWIATDHGGINVINKSDFSVRYLLNNLENPYSLSQNSILSLYKDNEGIIWIGTYKKGLNYYHENIMRFPLFNRHSEPRGLPYEDVNIFLEDDKGNLWIGTNGGGLLYFNRRTGAFTSYKHNPNDPTSLSSDVIVSMCIDHENKLWIGTYFGGLNCFDGKRFERFQNDPGDDRSLSGKSVWELFEDAENRLWVGTLEGGLNQFDRKSKKFIRYPVGGADSIRSTYIAALAQDREGNLWVGTSSGIDVMMKATNKFVHFEPVKNDPSTLLSHNIYDILQDSKGRIWIGTDGGLSIFNAAQKTFITFTEKDGLPHNSILTILEDEAGDLWLSTSNGLSRVRIQSVSPKIVDVRNYTQADGLQGLQFNEDAAYRTRDGELIFGGANGFNIFKPSQLGRNLLQPKVILSDFQLFNRSLVPNHGDHGDGLLKQTILLTDFIELPASENVFSIEFAALNFFQAEKNTYKYKLEGFNNAWLQADAKSRRVTYTNLDAGDYVFRVIAANNDGVWNQEGASLRIRVLPPFWKSNTAFVLYILLVVLGLLGTRKIIQQRERMKFAIRQERQEALRMHELDMMKIKFFTNVSHEFRTPLSLILSPVDDLIKESTDPDHKKRLNLIQRNAKRLLNLVNQLLDFRKLEVHEIKFQPSQGDIVHFIKDTVHSFSDLSEKKDIKVSFVTNVPSLETIFDQDKLEKILFNLLSNAFKFTPSKGTVSIAVDVNTNSEPKFIEFKVADTGIGIAPDKLDRIFDRFFQSDLPKSMVNQGSGIGLSITKEFVKIHGGTIAVESQPGAGTCFTVRLPLNEIVQTAAEVVPVLDESQNKLVNPEASAGEKPVILLVEDNEDFRFYLKDNLQVHYTIVEAGTGDEGWRMSLSHFPDLIVSDVMMPGMNGFELCQKIKSDQRVSHIPVILLTAKTGDAERLEGIESGADDYIHKPFNYEILESRIRNMIGQREKLRDALSKQAGIKASELQITSLDEQFIKNAIAIIEKNVSNTDFTVVDLSRELAISRAHFFKKVHSLTGKSPLEFIRAIRMQHAAQLLEKSQLSVAEVAYKVGFNNPKSFAKYFREIYHVLPSAYAAGKRRS
ncbi:MAG TPA: two-component regulator propeller domain-containing protein, partial [Chryseosolibacter sp.]|nr:two-component regulator propeller domain-containing protein [Chryseosolibacter sp.]